MVITQSEFDYNWFHFLPQQKRKKGNNATKQKFYYKDIITAFDIETSYIKEIDASVMYIWQWQFGDKCTVIGRTWQELRDFINNLKEEIGDDRLVVYVHNLSFEFQFLSGIFSFSPDDVFCMDLRKILRAMLKDCFEFRCSYLHSNMGLRPLTSTGYARRDAKKAMRVVGTDYIQKQLPTFEIYKLLREAFRGGNTHASRFYSNKILEDLNSADISSSYPYEIVNGLFPVTKFTIVKCETPEHLEEFIYTKKKAVLIRCKLRNVTLKDDLVPVPYISASKCVGIIGGAYDNGRVLSADSIELFSMTDIDYQIIKKQYNFDIEILTVATARYGKLPVALRECVLDYFKQKTTLKDKATDQEHTAEFYKLLYNKFKNLLNAQYGMMAQDPVKIMIKFMEGKEDLFEPEDVEPEVLLNDYNKHAFLAYQWGVYVCARARMHLQQGIDLCGPYFVYCDTDSCKYIGDSVDWDKINDAVRKEAKRNGTFASDENGNIHYMGLFEKEDHIKRFKTMGAKKYAYEDDDGKLHITIAGVNKRIGVKELERAAKREGKHPLEVMKEGFKFKYAGGIEARYSDYPEITEWITEDGVPIRITRNVSLVENSKTLGLTNEYRELLSTFKSFTIDI